MSEATSTRPRASSLGQVAALRDRADRLHEELVRAARGLVAAEAIAGASPPLDSLEAEMVAAGHGLEGLAAPLGEAREYLDDALKDTLGVVGPEAVLTAAAAAGQLAHHLHELEQALERWIDGEHA